jgi:hypothetical protein
MKYDDIAVSHDAWSRAVSGMGMEYGGLMEERAL